MNDLQKLFISELSGIYDGEQRLVKALGDIEGHDISEEAKEGFRQHLAETKNHVARVEEAFAQTGETPQTKTCHGIKGLIAEAEMIGEEFKEHGALESGLIGVALKSEHYETAAYGTLCTWAEELGLGGALAPLKENLREEKTAAAKLGRLLRLAEERLPKEGIPAMKRLFLRASREMLDAEHLLVSALAEVQYYAVSKLLKLAVHHHLGQTEKHVLRLEKAFYELGETADRKPCDGMEGIIDEAQVSVMEFLGNSALDAALIAAAQRVEHYEIASYENLCCWGEHLNFQSAVKLFAENLSDEISTDKALSVAAEWLRNPKARGIDSRKRTPETAEFLKLATHGG